MYLYVYIYLCVSCSKQSCFKPWFKWADSFSRPQIITSGSLSGAQSWTNISHCFPHDALTSVPNCQNAKSLVDLNSWPQNRQLKWPPKSFHNGQLASSVYLPVLWTLLWLSPLQSWSFRTWHLNMGPGRHWLISSWGRSNPSSLGSDVSTSAAVVSAL